jgi:hypothetical protein
LAAKQNASDEDDPQPDSQCCFISCDNFAKLVFIDISFNFTSSSKISVNTIILSLAGFQEKPFRPPIS